MVTRVFLVRHGETEWNAQFRHIGLTDLGLTEKGKKQAQALATTLKQIPLSAIYSSSLKRCCETAETIGQYHQLKVRIIPELKEIDFGAWEGHTSEELKRDYPELFEMWVRGDKDFKMPRGENWLEFQKRVSQTFEKILKENQGGKIAKEIAIISHGGPIKVIIAQSLKLDDSSFFKIQQNQAALNILEFNKTQATLTLLNDTCHLNPVISQEGLLID